MPLSNRMFIFYELNFKDKIVGVLCQFGTVNTEIVKTFNLKVSKEQHGDSRRCAGLAVR